MQVNVRMFLYTLGNEYWNNFDFSSQDKMSFNVYDNKENKTNAFSMKN